MLSKWRRHHYHGVVAEASPLAGIGTWSACAYRETAKAGMVHAPTRFTLLTDAQAAADALVRTSFGHTCVLECGVWTRRVTSRAGQRRRSRGW
jgi:hypothetical protein